MKYVVEDKNGTKTEYGSKIIEIDGDFFRFGNTTVPIALIKCIYLEGNQ